MPRVLFRAVLGLSVLVLGGGLLLADPPAPDKPDKKSDGPDLSEFKTVATAVTAQISRAAPSDPGEPGYLGVEVDPGPNGDLVVSDVQPDSPAAKANLQAGDLLAAVGGEKVASAEALRELVQAKSPGDKLTIVIVRKEKPMELTATVGAPSRPMKLTPPGQRAFLGVQLGEAKDGAAVEQVVSGSPAEAAGLKVGDVLAKFDGAPFTDANKLGDTLSAKKPGDVVALTLRRDGKDVELKVTLGAAPGGFRGWDDRNAGLWKKDVYRLAVVPVEYPDVKHNEKIPLKDWEESLFSSRTYTDKSVTGQKVFGSLHDFYQEQSYGALEVEGKVFDWVAVSKKRMDYSEGTGTTGQGVLLTEALDVLYDRDGKDALKDFDGVFFLYAGDRVQTNRGGLYWPHKANFSHKGKRWNYFICPELGGGGDRMANISTPCHEFGHMLGLPDLYARPENPGSEGLGKWCTMSEQLPNGRPQQFSAWCKEQLGWIKPAVIDPTVKQKLVLAPAEDSGKECFKVLLRPDGSEYVLLENRRKKGFDSDLPGEGLLIWRVVGNRPFIEESHGIGGPAGPGAFLEMVPYPTQANNAFTPYTTPSSRSELGGGLPVNITNIRKLPDGRITFYVGYEYE